MDIGNTEKPRLIFLDGRIRYFPTDELAYKVWLSLAKRVYCAFRGAGDKRPVYSHDCVDR
jgi:hypothetical protein